MQDSNETNNMSAKIAHLQIIQGVINRLASNSFDIKRWTIIIAAATIAALPRVEEKILLATFAAAAIIGLGALDGYYLWQERLFRNCYNQAIGSGNNNFQVIPKIRTEEKFGKNVKKWEDRYIGTVLSKTILAFYLIIGAFITLVAVATSQ